MANALQDGTKWLHDLHFPLVVLNPFWKETPQLASFQPSDVQYMYMPALDYLNV